MDSSTPHGRFRTVQSTLSAELAKPYVFGQADCFMLGCRMADALDPALGLAALYAGSYSTMLGAQRALRKRGHKSLVTLYAEHLSPGAPAMAQVGDLAILQLADGAEHVAVCIGDRFRTKTISGHSDHGLGEAIAGFRTGR